MTRRDELLERLHDPVRYINPEREEMRLLADAVEIADEACRETVERRSWRVDGVFPCWWDTGDPRSKKTRDELDRALSYLSRRGLIERKPGEPHLVRFVEE